jgi:NADP-dependent 3-hydroxy acid dehydrogenase YdfG
MSDRSRVAVITGASAGIGAATAKRLAAEGFEVVLGARRVDRIEALARELGGRALPLDVTDLSSVSDFAAAIDRLDLLVNNAGKALGMEKIEGFNDENVREMWETNVMGVLNMTRALLPKLKESSGHVVNVGSTSGIETYPGGAGYTASKHAVRAITRTLRFELVGTPIRVTEVNPGLVETEFSKVRFKDDDRAAKVYEGIEPLTADDIADCIAWAVTRPPHVNVDEIVVRPVAQASSTVVARKTKS